MRSVIPFDIEAGPKKIDEILSEYDWMIGGSPAGAHERREFWLKEISKVPPHAILDKQEAAFHEQLAAEIELLTEHLPDSEEIINKQRSAIQAQESAIAAERRLMVGLTEKQSGNGRTPRSRPGDTLVSLAAGEAREILLHVSPHDRSIANITFQYPVFDRRTQTFGTVHYELDKDNVAVHHVVIRLKNSQSEKLKVATQRLVADLNLGTVESRRSIRLLNALRALNISFLRLWYRSAHHSRRRIRFARIKVLEPGQSTEAFSGRVTAERSLASVIRERRSDIVVAGVFLTLGITTSILSSPMVYNFDYLTHAEKWTDGWLAWGAGNLSRIGSAFFVGVFVPLIQILLHWQSVRRKPSVSWNIDVADL